MIWRAKCYKGVMYEYIEPFTPCCNRCEYPSINTCIFKTTLIRSVDFAGSG